MTATKATAAQVRIEASSLRVSYGRFVAFHCDSADIEGNIIAVVGHNGAGKSTMIKALLGLLPIASGRLEVSLRSATGTRKLIPNAHMGFCPETGAVFGDISVESYIKLWCRIKHHDAKYYRRGGKAVIDMLTIAPLLKKKGRELSKGQKRRVQTAIGFLVEPQLFLFDEPFDGLDVQKTTELAEIIHEHRQRMSFIISSHRMDVMERLADVVVVLKDGAIVSCGSVEKVCCDLCPRSIVVDNIDDRDLAMSDLKRGLPRALVSRIGNQVSISGEGFDLAAIERIVGSSVSVVARTPSLVDAMNYHLKQVEVSQSGTE